MKLWLKTNSTIYLELRFRVYNNKIICRIRSASVGGEERSFEVSLVSPDSPPTTDLEKERSNLAGLGQPRGDLNGVINSSTVIPSLVRHSLPLILLGAKPCDSLKLLTPPEFTRPTGSRPCSRTHFLALLMRATNHVVSSLLGARRVVASDSHGGRSLKTRAYHYSSLRRRRSFSPLTTLL
jgi:hypothetical protein